VSASADSQAKLPLRIAMEARDLDAAVDAFAPDAVIHSPLTAKLTFVGHDQIGAILRIILDDFDEFHYTDELRSGESSVLVATARVAGSEIEMVDHMRHDEHGKIGELTVFFRPLPSIAVAMRVIGTALGRRQSASRAATISALTRPLGVMTGVGDQLGVRLVKPTL
jgi:hypothetical protein